MANFSKQNLIVLKLSLTCIKNFQSSKDSKSEFISYLALVVVEFLAILAIKYHFLHLREQRQCDLLA